MKNTQQPQDRRALHVWFSVTRTFQVALVVGLFSLTGAQSFGALAQQAYLKASNTGAGDKFGRAVAVSGDTMIVGAPSEDSNATTVNGDPVNNLALESGAAYVFVRSGAIWNLQAYLKAADGLTIDQFGTAVAISGDTVVVGAPSASAGGSAYVFVRDGTNWTQQRLLKASNAGGNFGTAVSVSGDTVVVGAPSESSNGTGVNGNQNDYSSFNAGAAYVFLRSGATWSQQAYLKASNAGAGDRFGVSVGVSGDTVVVGAVDESSNASTVNGDGDNNLAFGAGAAYVFARDGVTWSQQAYLKAANTEPGFTYPGDQFGISVSVSGDTVVVGAPNEASNANTVNGDGTDNSAPSAGAAYAFVRSGTNWSQQAYLKASNAEGGIGFNGGDQFGTAVAVAGEWIVVGAPDEDSSSPGVDGSQANGTNFNSGAAYLFTRGGTNWNQLAYLKASTPDGGFSDLELGDNFGSAVAVAGDTIVTGAFGESSSATGLNGDESDDSFPEAGAAYVFFSPPGAPGYVSRPYPPGSIIDFFLVHIRRVKTMYIGNEGTNNLRIESIEWAESVPGGAAGLEVTTIPALPLTIPTGVANAGLQVHLSWAPEQRPELRADLRVVTDDPFTPVALYGVYGVKGAGETALENTVLYLLSLGGAGIVGAKPATRSRNSLAGKGTALDLPPTATFTLDPGAPQSVAAEIPPFLGGGSVQLSNFTGSFTVSLTPVPNDTNRALIRVESGSFTAPSFTLPSGLVSGPNVLTFGPPEQSSGILNLTNGSYTVSAQATIVNNLIPGGFPVQGNYTGTYNAETDRVSLESQSTDLFEPGDRVFLNRSPSGLWLTWVNTNAVEEATSITGPWRTITNAASPYLVITTNHPQQFFRLRLPQP